MGSSASKLFEIPKFFLFGEGGIYSGSLDSRGFNYKVIPRRPKEGEKELDAFVWSGRMCIDKAEDVLNKRFPLSREGYDQMLAWLEEKCLEMPETAGYIGEQRKRAARIAEKYVDMEDWEQDTKRK
ncbi:MAG: hypothetical protein NC078_08155 [Ruminococcus sp.]|nr:hypothetical protein [Ruminococcus sp.]